MAKAKRARKKKAAAPPVPGMMEVLGTIAKRIGNRPTIRWGSGYSDLAASGASGDVRTDLGHPIDLRVPSGYRAQVKKVLEFYGNDPLFASLIRRFWEFGNTRFDWVVPPTGESGEAQAEKEQGFWNHWSGHVNSDLGHILPGTDALNVGIFKGLLLTGMAPMHWSWGYMDYDGKKVWAPVKMKIENQLGITLVPGSHYGSYMAFLRKQISENSTTDLANETEAGGEAAQLRRDKDFIELRYTNSFVLRFEHTAIDARVNRTQGGQFLTASASGADDRNAGYPEVPYISLQEAVQLRRGLAASDMRLIDGIINFMLIWFVGNDDKDAQGRLINLPRPPRKDDSGTEIEKSTLDTVKDWLETGENMDVAEWTLPYWVKPEIIMPDVAALLNSDKYLHATSEILHRFGIFLGEDASSPEIGRMNTVVFEAQLEHMRQTYVARFWEMMALRVKNHKRNRGVFKSGDPNYHWRPIQTRIAQWREELTQIAKMGRISSETLWRTLGLNPGAEAIRIRRENEVGLTKDLNDHAPVQFTQTVVGPDGEQKTVKDGGTTSRGRPKKMPGGKQKEE